MSTNTLFDIEHSIIERLKFATQEDQGDVPAWCNKVASIHDARFAREISQVEPAIYVAYDGFRVSDTNPSQTLEWHRWYVILLVKHAAAQRQVHQLNKNLSLYQHQIKAALKGFIPKGAASPLQELTPLPVSYEDTYVNFPFLYEARCLFSSQFGKGVAIPSKTEKPFKT